MSALLIMHICLGQENKFQFLDAEIKDFNTFIVKIEKEIQQEEAWGPRADIIRLRTLQHELHETKGLHKKMSIIAEFSDSGRSLGNIKKSLEVIQNDINDWQKTDRLLDSSIKTGGVININQKIKDTAEGLNIPLPHNKMLAAKDIVSLRGAIHRQLALLSRAEEALVYLIDTKGIINEEEVLQIIKKDAIRLPQNSYYTRLKMFINPPLPATASYRRGFIINPFISTEKITNYVSIPGERQARRLKRNIITSFPNAAQKASRSTGVITQAKTIAKNINKNAPGFLDKVGFIFSIPEVVKGITDYCGTYQIEKFKLQQEYEAYIRSLNNHIKNSPEYTLLKKEYVKLDIEGKISDAEYMIQKWCPKESVDMHHY